MTFEEILDQAIAMLQRRGRLTYGTLKRQFQLDDAALEDLKNELIEGQRLAVDERGNVLVWTGGSAAAPPAAAPAPVQAQALLTYTPPHLTDKILAARTTLEGERKQVTVLCADLKDSTELIRGLDPEAAQQLLDPAIHRMMDAVHRFEGTVNQVLGDGIMALFGAPIAHEDHALRACYAALAMQAAMRAYTDDVRRAQGLELRMRVGLNAGDVVVRTIGNDLHMDYSAVGETTHIAAGLGSAYALQGCLAEGRALLEEGVGEGIRTGGLQGQAYRVAWLSEVCRLTGRGEEAWQHARQALDLARQQKARGDEAFALHQLGVVHAHTDSPDVAQAEAHYQQALALADGLGMRPLVAHCHLGLGRLYGQTGRGEEARAALTAAIALYRAMDMTFWLPQAETAVAEVEGR